MPRKVLVVGAGPVGLIVAIQLKRQGVDVDIIDKSTSANSYSKALSINAATLKSIHGLRLSDSFLKVGKPIRDIDIFYQKKRCAHIDNRYLPKPYDYYLSLPQPETERLLRGFVAKL